MRGLLFPLCSQSCPYYRDLNAERHNILQKHTLMRQYGALVALLRVHSWRVEADLIPNVYSTFTIFEPFLKMKRWDFCIHFCKLQKMRRITMEV